MRAIAHEFRHTQQHRLWDTDIPKVEWEAKNSPASPRDSTDKAMIEVYRNDPGEIDARQFANKFEDAFDEKFLRKIGRLALRYHRRHAKEYIQAMSDYYKSTGEKDSASSKQ